MKKLIDLNDNPLLDEIKRALPYFYLVMLGIGLFEYCYYYNTEILFLLLTQEDTKNIQVIMLKIMKYTLYFSFLAFLLYHAKRFTEYIYYRVNFNVTWHDFIDFNKKVKRMQHLKITLKRIRANIDDEFPLVELEKHENMYKLNVYKNHWFNREQVEKNTDFFKSVIKLPLYQITEDYNKIVLTFTMQKIVMTYKEFMRSFEQGKILLGYDENQNSIFWNYNEIPHLLGVGTTGSGKSVFQKNLIDCMILNGADIKFADGKRVEMIRYQFMGYKVYTENFLKLFREYHRQMMLRYQRMEQESIATGKIINHYTLLEKPPKPSFLIIDEWASITDNLSRETPKGSAESEYKEVIRLIKDIGQLGRAGGIQIVMFMQDPKATTLDTSIRNNMNMRVLLGRVKEKTAYDMLFGSEYRNLETQKGAGSGYYMSNDEPQLFNIPLWEDIGITRNE